MGCGGSKSADIAIRQTENANDAENEPDPKLEVVEGQLKEENIANIESELQKESGEYAKSTQPLNDSVPVIGKQNTEAELDLILLQTKSVNGLNNTEPPSCKPAAGYAQEPGFSSNVDEEKDAVYQGREGNVNENYSESETPAPPANVSKYSIDAIDSAPLVDDIRKRPEKPVYTKPKVPTTRPIEIEDTSDSDEEYEPPSGFDFSKFKQANTGENASKSVLDLFAADEGYSSANVTPKHH
eukprot:Nk52_evm70s207 gene=Nk52_evmTU70s207